MPVLLSEERRKDHLTRLVSDFICNHHFLAKLLCFFPLSFTKVSEACSTTTFFYISLVSNHKLSSRTDQGVLEIKTVFPAFLLFKFGALSNQNIEVRRNILNSKCLRCLYIFLLNI